MATYGYDPIHVRSEDTHAARAYWENAFSAPVVQERELGSAPSFTFDLNGMHFLMSGRAEGEHLVKSGSEPRYGLDHFGLLVDDMDSAASGCEDRQAQGKGVARRRRVTLCSNG